MPPYKIMDYRCHGSISRTFLGFQPTLGYPYHPNGRGFYCLNWPDNRTDNPRISFFPECAIFSADLLHRLRRTIKEFEIRIFSRRVSSCWIVKSFLFPLSTKDHSERDINHGEETLDRSKIIPRKKMDKYMVILGQWPFSSDNYVTFFFTAHIQWVPVKNRGN